MNLIWNCLLISIEPRPWKYVKGYRFLSFAWKSKIQIFDKGLDPSKKEVHKAGEFIGTKITDAARKSNSDKIVKQESVEEIIISPEERKHYTNWEEYYKNETL